MLVGGTSTVASDGILWVAFLSLVRQVGEEDES